MRLCVRARARTWSTGAWARFENESQRERQRGREIGIQNACNKKHIWKCARIWIQNSGQIMFNFQKNNRLNVRALLKRNTHHVYVYVVVSARAHSKCETCVQVMPYLIHRSENHFNLNRKNKIRQQAIKKKQHRMLTLIANRMQYWHRCNMLAVKWNGIY